MSIKIFDICQYNLSKEALECLVEFLICVSHGEEFRFDYNDKEYCIDASGGKLIAYENFDDLLLNYIVDGKPLIERFADLV
jgi:hypothetical protein